MGLKVITDMQMYFFAYDIIKHWQCHHKLDAYKTRKGKTILLGWRSLQSTFSHVHHISLQLKKKNKRCAKLTDGNNGKTIPGDCGDEKEKPLQSNYKFKKIKKAHVQQPF